MIYYKYLILMFVFISMNINANSQDWYWAKTATSQFEAVSRSIITDKEGNSFITGNFLGINMYLNNIHLSSHDLARSYIFVAKYDSSGNVIWANCGGSPSGNNWDYGNGIALDGNGNCYVAGSFADTLVYGSDTLLNSGLDDVFVAKFDTTGVLIWLKKGGSAGNDQARSIVVDEQGNSYITGFFGSSFTVNNFIIGNDTLTSNGNSDIFIAKFDSSGDEIWARGAGDWNNDEGYGITIDENNDLYVTGFFPFTIIFGNDTLVSNGNADVFIAKYDSSGNSLWARKCGGLGVEKGIAISADHLGNLYLTGTASDSSIFGNDTLYGYGIFISKFDILGNELWVKQQGIKINNQNNSYCISADNSGNVYLSGQYRDTLSFGNDTLYTIGHSMDLFVTKFNSAGNVLWMRSANDGASGQGVSFDNKGNCYLAGWIVNSADFGNILLYCLDQDLFIAKLSCGGVIPEIIFTESDSSLHCTFAVSFQWYFNGIAIPGANFQTYHPTQNGNYSVFARDTNGCGDFSTTYNYTNVSISETSKENFVSVFPNPFSSIVFFDYSIKSDPITKIDIQNLLGEKIQSSVKSYINLSVFSDGVYFYSAKSKSGKIWTGKIIKQN